MIGQQTNVSLLLQRQDWICVPHLISQLVAKFVYKSTGYVVQVTGIIVDEGCDHGLVFALSEIHHFLVDDSDIQVSRITANGQVEAGQLEDREQETEDNTSGK